MCVRAFACAFASICGLLYRHISTDERGRAHMHYMPCESERTPLMLAPHFRNGPNFKRLLEAISRGTDSSEGPLLDAISKEGGGTGASYAQKSSSLCSVM